MALQGALGGSPGRPPRWTQNRPPYGGICAGTSGICACKQIYMFTRGRGGYVRRFGGMCGRPAGYVRRGAPCVRGFGDMCGICACGKKRGVREICPGMCGSPWVCAGTSIPHKAAQTDGHPGTRALKTCFDIKSKHMGQASFVMMVMGARSCSKEATPRLYPTAHIPAHTPKPGKPHQIQAHRPSLFRNDGNGGQKLLKRSEASSVSHRTDPRTYPKTWQSTSNPSTWAKPLW
jgi:hypothetical protein